MYSLRNLVMFSVRSKNRKYICIIKFLLISLFSNNQMMGIDTPKMQYFERKIIPLIMRSKDYREEKVE